MSKVWRGALASPSTARKSADLPLVLWPVVEKLRRRCAKPAPQFATCAPTSAASTRNNIARHVLTRADAAQLSAANWRRHNSPGTADAITACPDHWASSIRCSDETYAIRLCSIVKVRRSVITCHAMFRAGTPNLSQESKRPAVWTAVMRNTSGGST
jgi:hypothetical protein